MSTVDRIHHFHVMVGNCCDGARLAGLPVRVELDDGSVVEGVPSQSATVAFDAADQLDHTGVAQWLELDGTPVELERVRSYSVARAGCAPDQP